MCASNRVIIFWILLDIQENVQWPRFLAHPVVIKKQAATCSAADTLILARFSRSSRVIT